MKLEHAKSLLLALLIGFSLWQSYLLAYSSPNYEYISQTKFYATMPQSDRLEKADLLQPQMIVIHDPTREDPRTAISRQNTDPYYHLIIERLQSSIFTDIHKISPYTVSFSEIRERQPFIEVVFPDALPVETIQHIFNLNIGNILMMDAIQQVLIIQDEGQQLRALFVSENYYQIYEASVNELTLRDFRFFLTFLDYMPAYEAIYNGNEVLYLPLDSIDVSSYILSYEELEGESLLNSLFVDPGIARLMRERDDSEIYTDGKRGLRIRKEQRWITFRDAASPVKDSWELHHLEVLPRVIQFINQHGGWNGNYTLSMIPKSTRGEGWYTFQLYLDGFPIMNEPDLLLAEMRVEWLEGSITGFERPLWVVDFQDFTTSKRRLIAGNLLRQRLQNQFGNLDQITKVYPALRPSLLQDELLLKPVWAAELKNGTVEVVR